MVNSLLPNIVNSPLMFFCKAKADSNREIIMAFKTYFTCAALGAGLFMFAAPASANNYYGHGYAPHNGYQHNVYQGGAFQQGAFHQGGFNGIASECQGAASFAPQVNYKPIKTRYGIHQETQQVRCEMGGYWVYPSGYVAETPIIQTQITEVEAPAPTPAPLPALEPIVIQQDCPLGQYWTHEGVCSGAQPQAPRVEIFDTPNAYPEPEPFKIPSYVIPRK